MIVLPVDNPVVTVKGHLVSQQPAKTSPVTKIKNKVNLKKTFCCMLLCSKKDMTL